MQCLKISPGLLIWGSAALLLLPMRWMAAWMLAVCIHESGHLAMLRVLRIPVSHFSVDGTGARIRTQFSAKWKELLCALAGPAAGLLMLFLVNVFPKTAICSAFLSLYNLLPVYPMDGGRCIRCVMGEQSEKIVQNFTLAGILILGFYGTACLHLGAFPFLLACFTWIRTLRVKIPCKEVRQALQ